MKIWSKYAPNPDILENELTLPFPDLDNFCHNLQIGILMLLKKDCHAFESIQKNTQFDIWPEKAGFM